MTVHNMAKRNKLYPRDEAALRNRLVAAIANIRMLSENYDRGQFSASVLLAVEIQNVVTQLLVRLGTRKSFLYTSTAAQYSPRNLMAEAMLCGFDWHVEGDDSTPLHGYIRFQHFGLKDIPHKPRHLKFSDWWNETIIRASASPNPGLGIPTDPAKQIP